MTKKIHFKEQVAFSDLYKMNIPTKLNENNIWLLLSDVVPWKQIEEILGDSFRNLSIIGRPKIKSRVAVGALIIQNVCKLSDRETVEAIEESPYKQRFLGFKDFCMQAPFSPSMLTLFRERIGPDLMKKIIEATWMDMCIQQYKTNVDGTNPKDISKGIVTSNAETALSAAGTEGPENQKSALAKITEMGKTKCPNDLSSSSSTESEKINDDSASPEQTNKAVSELSEKKKQKYT